MRDNDLRVQPENAAAQMLTHIDAAMDARSQEMRLLADSVAELNEAIEREGRSIREEIRRTARETQALLKLPVKP